MYVLTLELIWKVWSFIHDVNIQILNRHWNAAQPSLFIFSSQLIQFQPGIFWTVAEIDEATVILTTLHYF